MVIRSFSDRRVDSGTILVTDGAMMSLAPGEPVESSGNAAQVAPQSLLPSRGMLAKPLSHRRRRSKGTIAGFAQGKAGEASSEMNGDATGSSDILGAGANASSAGQGNQPQHVLDSSTAPAKPCHSARLALMSCQNAIRLGARTQLGLCPPGRARRNLQAALQSQFRADRKASSPLPSSSVRGESEIGGYYGLDKMLGEEALSAYDKQEEDFLMTNKTHDVESDEEASSGDEDELNNLDDLLSVDGAPALDDEKKYLNLQEPLFTPPVGDAALSNPKGTPTHSSGSSGKLPFNRRKIQYFDVVTAVDRIAARNYLKEESKRSKKRDGIMLVRHLRRMQRRERRQAQIDRGEKPDFDNSDDEAEDPEEQELLTGGVRRFPQPMTPALSAALVLESLSLNPLESVEGMAKCYDGIVAAGVALLESQLGEDSKSRPSRSEIMATLAPLLITSLEPATGEVLLQLATLRRMCGTDRYQRRFVQRIAPCLVRPPKAAMWCLRHQNDMEPILAAVELIFDSAFGVFSKGWYERGQLLLADSARRETLNSAAQQLKYLSSEAESDLSLKSSHGLRRGKSLVKGDGSRGGGGSERLAEWEVIAVDRQIRLSISNVLSNEWTRVLVSSRDSDSVSIGYRRYTPASSPSMGRTRTSAPESPRGRSSPISPPRPDDARNVASPPPPVPSHSRTSGYAIPDRMESVFGPSFSSQAPTAVTETRTPTHENEVPPPPAQHVSPLLPRRPAVDDREARSSNRDTHTSVTAPPRSPTPLSPDQNHPSSSPAVTPPRSPTDAAPPQASPVTSLPQASPQRVRNPPVAEGSMPSGVVISPTAHPGYPGLERVDRAPLSPTHGGATTTSEVVAYRQVSSASSVTSTGSGSSQPAHYRMLTSTAAERKRTVAACRALRAQISRFEEAFMQLHGRAPRGAAERAPLATTYAQYREWKRAIRADAACRIQALFRGARTRWSLLRSGNPRMTRVVKMRAGRPSFAFLSEKLSIPTEIGTNEVDRGLDLAPFPGANTGVEVFVSNPSQAAPFPMPRRRSGSDGMVPHGPSTPPYGSPSATPSPTASLSNLSLPELQARKRELKQQLRQYDMNFARQHNRLPVKAEKEPIRHLYENYNALKAQINLLEQENQQFMPAIQPMLSQRSPSPPPVARSSPDSGEDAPSVSHSAQTMVMARSSRRKSLRAGASSETPQAAAASTATGAQPPSEDLAALKSEKSKLHQMLRSYEKDFYKEHNRQVSSFSDIRPVASQYRRYKEIKKAIAALQQTGANK